MVEMVLEVKMVVMDKVKTEVVMVVEVQVKEVEVVLSPLWKYAAMSLAYCQETSQSAKKSRGHVSAWIYPPSILPSSLPRSLHRPRGFTVCSPGTVTSTAPGSQRRPTNGIRVGFDCGCRVWTLLPALPSSAPRSLRLIYRSKIPLH